MTAWSKPLDLARACFTVLAVFVGSFFLDAALSALLTKLGV